MSLEKQDIVYERLLTKKALWKYQFLPVFLL